MTTMIDSNIWIYYIDTLLPEHPYVVDTVDKAIRSGVVLNTIVLIEVSHYLFAQLKNTLAASAERRLRTLSTARIYDFGLHTYDLAVTILQRYRRKGIVGRDAAILATMQEAGIDTLLTHDTAFKDIPFIQAIDPIPDHI